MKPTTREVILGALFVALITVGTFIRIPVGGDVFTLQFLFTLLAGLILGAKLGAMSVAVYILLGLIGVPVFASGGGMGYVMQPTFGYLVGFVLQAFFCGYFSRRLKKVSIAKLIFINYCGLLIVYLFGVSYFYFATVFILQAPLPLWTLLLYSCFLQMPPDFLLCVVAAYVGLRCRNAGLWV